MSTLHGLAKLYGWGKSQVLELTPAEIDYLGNLVKREQAREKMNASRR